ncbi:DEKNAAC101360 [Brettanomyces naardenensis]|uniref:DEKNAAC101360 n=1 Tax=Brettanomyces naardenensis TaxID=13370 RepID=A0A448YHK3_BRENA|nr:DEKNAAC101360 [Brettanomyces naardenensis]
MSLSQPLPKPSETTIRLGSKAPNFTAQTSNGPVTFYDYQGDSWVVLFSHPDDFTPVCTTELGAFAKLEPEFSKRNTKLIGLSANTVEKHEAWIKDINEVTGAHLTFPIIADPKREIALKFDMIDYQDATNVDDKGVQLTIRSVFVIDPTHTVRLIITYPASVGRNTAEVLRVLDSLQLSEKHNKTLTTPVNWVPGDDVIVVPTLPEEKARKLYPNFRSVKPYLRLSPLPNN